MRQWARGQVAVLRVQGRHKQRHLACHRAPPGDGVQDAFRLAGGARGEPDHVRIVVTQQGAWVVGTGRRQSLLIRQGARRRWRAEDQHMAQRLRMRQVWRDRRVLCGVDDQHRRFDEVEQVQVRFGRAVGVQRGAYVATQRDPVHLLDDFQAVAAQGRHPLAALYSQRGQGVCQPARTLVELGVGL